MAKKLRPAIKQAMERDRFLETLEKRRLEALGYILEREAAPKPEALGLDVKSKTWGCVTLG